MQDDDIVLGGENVRVQFDETAICDGQIIKDPSNTEDESNNRRIQWLVGGVEVGNCGRFVLKLVPNRKSETIYEIFLKHVHPGSIIVTDGYPSYPSAVRRFNGRHLVVNHSNEFVTSDGVHTNSIENLWSHLKMEYRSRAGISGDRLMLFLNEFTWTKRYCIHDDLQTLKEAFVRIIMLF
ncbi:hypothetical protein DMUE_4820 [Dictyocoela muelleri]|nr:hypothetical protein DMUE_4820 [Dictyocoela muelleri]